MNLARLSVFLALPFCSCAGTRVSENGKTVFYTQMNCAYMEYRSPAGSRLIVHGMNHSTPTRAGGSVIGTAATGATSLATAIITKGLIK